MSPDGPHAGAVCVDVGSVWTKAVLVQPDGGLAGFAAHLTTPADVLAGVDAAVRAVTAPGGSGSPDLLACSSAGGGLRLAVVGTEKLSSTEAGHRVARSAGSHVVHVHGGPLEAADVRALRGSRPGVVLLIGGPDGDDPRVLLHNAAQLARARVRYPIVLAGNTEARAAALSVLRSTSRTVVACDNVLARAGELAPEPARAAVASVFARHVLGARGPGAAPRFRRMARLMTPDAVGRAATVLAKLVGTGTLVVDIGCAMTDVHLAPVGGRPAVGAHCTIEGDLGLRCAAAGVLLEGQAEGIVDPVEADLLGPIVERMSTETGSVPRGPGGAAEDRRIAALAAVIAVRRHLRSLGDLAVAPNIGLVVFTGGVFRQRDPAGLAALIATLRADSMLAPVLADSRVVVDADFTVAPAGLLAEDGRGEAAEALLMDHLLG
ncbi:glutamate mutase L [Pseudonocardia hispaniensis]|uniref:Glutamate mutase L n=1 Tax=Pseudonocardia hispaniensis TaxID=904933 RepID=A0ABW1J498_9PSEU